MYGFGPTTDTEVTAGQPQHIATVPYCRDLACDCHFDNTYHAAITAPLQPFSQEELTFYENIFLSFSTINAEPTPEDLADYAPEEEAEILLEMNSYYSASRGV